MNPELSSVACVCFYRPPQVAAETLSVQFSLGWK